MISSFLQHSSWRAKTVVLGVIGCTLVIASVVRKRFFSSTPIPPISPKIPNLFQITASVNKRVNYPDGKIPALFDLCVACIAQQTGLWVSRPLPILTAQDLLERTPPNSLIMTETKCILFSELSELTLVDLSKFDCSKLSFQNIFQAMPRLNKIIITETPTLFSLLKAILNQKLPDSILIQFTENFSWQSLLCLESETYTKLAEQKFSTILFVFQIASPILQFPWQEKYQGSTNESEKIINILIRLTRDWVKTGGLKQSDTQANCDIIGPYLIFINIHACIFHFEKEEEDEIFQMMEQIVEFLVMNLKNRILMLPIFTHQGTLWSTLDYFDLTFKEMKDLYQNLILLDTRIRSLSIPPIFEQGISFGKTVLESMIERSRKECSGWMLLVDAHSKMLKKNQASKIASESISKISKDVKVSNNEFENLFGFSKDRVEELVIDYVKRADLTPRIDSIIRFHSENKIKMLFTAINRLSLNTFYILNHALIHESKITAKLKEMQTLLDETKKTMQSNPKYSRSDADSFLIKIIDINADIVVILMQDKEKIFVDVNCFLSWILNEKQ